VTANQTTKQQTDFRGSKDLNKHFSKEDLRTWLTLMIEAGQTDEATGD
jgi:hypothetical protein